jgi:hypothetical protein
MLQSFLSIFLDSTVTALTASSNVIGRVKKKRKRTSSYIWFDFHYVLYPSRSGSPSSSGRNDISRRKMPVGIYSIERAEGWLNFLPPTLFARIWSVSLY